MNGSYLVAFASLAMLITMPPVQAQALDFRLAHGESELIQHYFASGELIQATCNEHCLDLDLYLYDIDGNLLSKDTTLDIAPTLSVPYDGNFLLEVFMPSCNHPEGCTAQVFSQKNAFNALPSD